MYSKDELSAKSVLQLKNLAKEIGVKIKSGDNKETIIYTILDALAEASADGAAQKRKRTRIASRSSIFCSWNRGKKLRFYEKPG